MRAIQQVKSMGIALRKRNGRLDLPSEDGKKSLAPVCVSSVRIDNRPDEEGYARIQYRPEIAHMFLTDRDGQLVEALRDGTWRLQDYQLCANNPVFVQEALRLIKQILKSGVDGVVLRHGGTEQNCYSEGKHIGYAFDAMCSEIPWFEQYDKRVLALPVHSHLRPGEDQPSAFRRFLKKAVRLVRQSGKGRLVILEADPALAEGADGVLVRVPPGRMEFALAQFERPGCPQVLIAPYPAPDRSKEDTLRDLARTWTAGFTYVVDTRGDRELAPKLRRFNRGRCLAETAEIGGISYAVFENCVVAWNPEDRERTTRLKLPVGFTHKTLLDLATGKAVPLQKARSMERFSIHDLRETTPEEMDMVVRMPAQSGRLYAKPSR